MNAVDVKPSYDELLQENDRINRQNATLLFALDQSNATRDDITQGYQESLQEIEELKRQLEQKDLNHKRELEQLEQKLVEKEKRVTNLFTELSWIRKIHYNPTFKPVEKDVLITSHDHTRSGEGVRLYVGTKAKQTGMARNTYGSTLQKLNDFGVIEWEVSDAKKTEDGFGREGMLKFPDQLLKNPDEIVIDRGAENRGGNAKEKAAKKACPECSSVQVEEGKMCFCKNCNHQWEEGKRKDANIVTPEDEMREAANKPRSEDVTEEELHHHMNTLFPDEEKPKAKAKPPKGSFEDDPFSPPTPTCIVCRKPRRIWSEGLATYTCGTDHTLEDTA